MFYCYILQSVKSGRFYTGSSENPKVRLVDHNSGKVTSTRNKGPWVIVHQEEFGSRSLAVQREREIKGWKSAEKIQELIDRATDLPEYRDALTN